MNKKIIGAVVAAIIISAGFLVYYEFVDNGGNVNVKVADAPVGASAVFITFNNVYVHSTSSGWHNFSVSSRTINILNLTTTNAALFSSISLKAGMYTGIELGIVNVTVVMGGSRLNFTSSNGYVDIHTPFNVSAHTTTNLVIEFNLTQDLNMVSEMFTPTASMVVS